MDPDPRLDGLAGQSIERLRGEPPISEGAQVDAAGLRIDVSAGDNVCRDLVEPVLSIDLPGKVPGALATLMVSVAGGVADRGGAAIVGDRDGLYRVASLLTGNDPAAQNVGRRPRPVPWPLSMATEASERTWLHRIAHYVIVLDAARQSNRVVPTAEVEALWRNDDYHVDTNQAHRGLWLRTRAAAPVSRPSCSR